ncbi:MAG: dihydrolipoyl dehydrogenase [Candidatus Hydrogenedentes bacterium]|nr:dihydrolipoyl dehydrogenase [Candidatus Hydrogenedentota bacterium]
MSSNQSTQVAVLGGGPGGYAAAFMAADLGLDVTLIDVEANPGGTCLYRGCIPSKALLHVAKVINEARESTHFGLTFGEPQIDLNRVRNATDAVVNQMTGGLGQLVKARKINYIQGRGTFVNSKNLVVTLADGKQIKLAAEYTIIAAGSRPARFGPLIESERIMNSTGALKLTDIPESLLLVGGGYIGLELGTVYSALGSEVTCVEMTGGLLPGADRDLVKPLQARLETQFKEILLNTKIADMKEQKTGIKVTLEGENLKKPQRTFDKVLVSIGRKPNSSGLGLKSTGVVVNDRGFIEVDAQMRTADPNIFAIGDIVGGAMLAHKASAEGRVAAEVIAGHHAAFEPQAIPAVVFTDPEVAWCGLTEEEARRTERNVHIARFPWAASGRATTINRMEGMTKIISDPETHRLLGMGIVGAGAGELIAEGTLAIEMGALVSDMDLTIHPHPTLSETVMEAAGSVFGTATHIYRPKKH